MTATTAPGPTGLSRCPACGAPWRPRRALSVELGARAEVMLTAELRRRLPRLDYRRCGRCASVVAIDGRRDAALLAGLYEAMPLDYWDELADPSRFARRLEAELPIAGGRDLWDVGCGDGRLLRALAPAWTKHGVEPGRTAVARAAAGGLDVREGTASGLALAEVADVVLAIDVLEHLVDPRAELAAMARMLRPGGTLALYTGAADALASRLADADWYYLHCVGHVTVFSATALAGALRALGLVDVRRRRVEHPAGVGARRWWRAFATNRVKRLLGRPPAPLYFWRDHQLVLARRPAHS